MFTMSSGAEGAAIEHVSISMHWGTASVSIRAGRWGVAIHVDVEIGVYVVQTDEWDRSQIFLDRIL